MSKGPELGRAAPDGLDTIRPGRLLLGEIEGPGRLDPAFGLLIPSAREAINRRTNRNLTNGRSTDSSARTAPGRQKGISWGCVPRSFERAVVRLGIAKEVERLRYFSKSSPTPRDHKRRLFGRPLRGRDFTHPDRARPGNVVFLSPACTTWSAWTPVRRLAFALSRGRRSTSMIHGTLPNWTRRSRPRPVRSDRLPAEFSARPLHASDKPERILPRRSGPTDRRFVRDSSTSTEWNRYGGRSVRPRLPAISKDGAFAGRMPRDARDGSRSRTRRSRATRTPRITSTSFGTLKPKSRLVLPLSKQAAGPWFGGLSGLPRF